MVAAMRVLPHLNHMLAEPDADEYQAVRDIAAQEGVSLRQAVEQTGILDQLPDDAAVIRTELDSLSDELSRKIIEAVRDASQTGRPVHFEWHEIEPGVEMTAEVEVGADAGSAVEIHVSTPHGRHFPT